MFKSLKMWLVNLLDSDRGYSPVVFSSFVLQEHVIIETLIEEDHIGGLPPLITDKATSILMRLNHVVGRCSTSHYLARMEGLPAYGRHKQYRIILRDDKQYLDGSPKELPLPTTLLDVIDIPVYGDSDYIKPNKDLCDAIHPDLWARVSERK